MKVVLVTGSYPPDICGVADYTARLEESLRRRGVEVTVYSGKRWGIRDASWIAKELRTLRADVLHIEYPATGYGWSLGPQLLSLLLPLVVTVHECSQGHWLRQVSLYPFSLRGPRIIFTNVFERRYANKFAPWISSRSCVIPIGSNVEVVPHSVGRNPNIVTYFGLIRPKKGLEQVLELARCLKGQGGGLRVRVVGTVMPGCEDYHLSLRQEANSLDMDWVLGLDGEELSRALATTDVAYLPFPDGASERRGTLMAMLANRAAVISTLGPHTPTEMEGAVLFANTPVEAANIVHALSRDQSTKSRHQEKAGEFARRFSWESIASEHVTIYQKLIERVSTR